MKALVWLVGLGLGLIAGAAEGRSYRSIRDCDVWRETGSRPVRACRVARGTVFKSMERINETVARIAAPKCQGLIRLECVGVSRRSASTPDPQEPVAPQENERPGLRSSWGDRAERPLRLALEIQVDAVSGAVAYSDQGSSGLGYGGLLGLEVPIGIAARLRVGLGYQSLQLQQSYDGSGALEDTAVDFSQRRGFLSASALAGWSFNADTGGGRGGLEWWAEGGLEYDHPLSASQTTASSSIDFVPVDKLLLVTAGLRGDFLLDNGLGLDGFLRFYYNLGSQEGSSLHGFRFGGAIKLAL